jgi:hypothetical protein
MPFVMQSKMDGLRHVIARGRRARALETAHGAPARLWRGHDNLPRRLSKRRIDGRARAHPRTPRIAARAKRRLVNKGGVFSGAPSPGRRRLLAVAHGPWFRCARPKA